MTTQLNQKFNTSFTAKAVNEVYRSRVRKVKARKTFTGGEDKSLVEARRERGPRWRVIGEMEVRGEEEEEEVTCFEEEGRTMRKADVVDKAFLRMAMC